MQHNEHYHVPVLLQEAVDALDVNEDGIYLDATVGGGGHMSAIAARLGPRGVMVGIDRDPDAIGWATTHPPVTQARVVLALAPFSHFPEVLARERIDGLDGILLDLGLSSRQIDEPQRGFSYKADSPLDMRMNPGDARTAADILHESSEEELAQVLTMYGEVQNARRMAHALHEQRESLTTSGDVRGCLEKEYGPQVTIKAFAKLFQALRIAVNNELEELAECLAKSANALRAGGRLVVIAYHSLEDRIVKNFMRDSDGRCSCPPQSPVCICGRPVVFKRITRKAIVPGVAEIQRNPRSRSARMRVAEHA